MILALAVKACERLSVSDGILALILSFPFSSFTFALLLKVYLRSTNVAIVVFIVARYTTRA